MARRRRLEPDTRPRWDDPELKATAHHNMRGWEEVTPEFRQGLSSYMLAGGNKEPTWRYDPTYHMRIRAPRSRNATAQKT